MFYCLCNWLEIGHLEIWSTDEGTQTTLRYSHLMHHSLQWHHNGHDTVSNHQSHHCFLYRLFRRRSKKTSKLRVTGLCAGNSPGTGEFPAQMASKAENVSIWWCHHGRLKENINHSLTPQKTPHISPVRLTYGMFFMMVWRKLTLIYRHDTVSGK